jgi:pimeloyl-ACP methyl ester carboxylesterase
MQHFSSDGVDIAFLDEGEGEPILLIHGFASTAIVNWRSTGWIDLLKKDGRRVIALDNRGHGESQKLRDPAAYSPTLMAGDAANLLEHLGIARADVMGYSMGARNTFFLAVNHPAKVRSAILGGLGMGLINGIGGEMAIAAALEAPDIDSVSDGQGRMFRKFAEQTKSDLGALAACIRVSRAPVAAERLHEIRAPVLVAVGSKDTVAGSGQELARLIKGAEFLEIPGRDHMLATGDKAFKNGVLDFLARRP